MSFNRARIRRCRTSDEHNRYLHWDRRILPDLLASCRSKAAVDKSGQLHTSSHFATIASKQRIGAVERYGRHHAGEDVDGGEKGPDVHGNGANEIVLCL